MPLLLAFLDWRSTLIFHPLSFPLIFWLFYNFLSRKTEREKERERERESRKRERRDIVYFRLSLMLLDELYIR